MFIHYLMKVNTVGLASTFGFAGILAGSLIVALDAVALSPSLPTIENAFGATTIQVYWAGVCYTLGAATCLPPFPAASDACGRRPISVLTLCFFLIGTIVCGTAQSIAALLAGRVIQGIGGGGIIGMLYVVISDLFDMRWRPKALAINGLVWLVGTSCGPIIGGGFSTHVTWRWIFWIALPINGVALGLVIFFLNIPRVKVHIDPSLNHLEKATAKSKVALSSLNWKTIDYIGAALMVTSLSSFLIPITWAGVQYSWSSYQTLVPLILGICGILSFVLYEHLVPAKPILPLTVLNNRTVAIAFLQTLALGLIQFGLIFYLPLYYQIVKGYDPLISGVALLPETFLAGPFTVISGIIISKSGKYKYITLVGWIIMALGCGLLVLLDQNTTPAQWIFINVPTGIAIGIVFGATPMAAQAPVKEEHMAIASGLIGFFRSIGQALGIAIGNAIVNNVLQTRLQDASSVFLRDNAREIARNIASSALLSAAAQNPAEMTELLDAYVYALHIMWWFLFGTACFCAVSTFLIKDVSLDRPGHDKSIESPESSSSRKDSQVEAPL